MDIKSKTTLKTTFKITLLLATGAFLSCPSWYDTAGRVALLVGTVWAATLSLAFLAKGLPPEAWEELRTFRPMTDFDDILWVRPKGNVLSLVALPEECAAGRRAIAPWIMVSILFWMAMMS
jgi:hypothetical protein